MDEQNLNNVIVIDIISKKVLNDQRQRLMNLKNVLV